MAKVRKAPPVEIVQREGRAINLEVKRFYIPGAVLVTKCPKCGADCREDFGDHYLSYPTANTTFAHTLNCYAQNDDGEPCDHEWDVPLRIDILVTSPGEQ